MVGPIDPKQNLRDELDPDYLSDDPADELDDVIDEDDPLIGQETLSEQDEEMLLQYDDADALPPDDLDGALIDYVDELDDEQA